MTWLRFLPPSCLFAASLHHFLSSKRLVHCADGQQQQQQQQRQQKSRPALRDQRLDDRVFLVAGIGGAAIAIILVLAYRTSAKTERVHDFIGAVERRLNGNRIVQKTIGNVYASGTYELKVTSKEASGYLNVASAGPVRGVVTVTATSKGALPPLPLPKGYIPWNFANLTLKIDKVALDARNAERAEIALKAGYKDAAPLIALASDSAMGESGVSVEDPPPTAEGEKKQGKLLVIDLAGEDAKKD